MEVVLTRTDLSSHVVVKNKLNEFLDTPNGLEIQSIVANFYSKTGFTINNDSITDLLTQLSQGNTSSDFLDTVQDVFRILQQSLIKKIIPKKGGSKTKKRGKNKKNKRGKSSKRGGAGYDILKQPLSPVAPVTDLAVRVFFQLLTDAIVGSMPTAPPPTSPLPPHMMSYDPGLSPDAMNGKNNAMIFVIIVMIIFVTAIPLIIITSFLPSKPRRETSE